MVLVSCAKAQNAENHLTATTNALTAVQNNARTLDSLDLWQCAHHFSPLLYNLVLQCKTFKANLVLLAIVLPMNYELWYFLLTEHPQDEARMSINEPLVERFGWGGFGREPCSESIGSQECFRNLSSLSQTHSAFPCWLQYLENHCGKFGFLATRSCGLLDMVLVWCAKAQNAENHLTTTTNALTAVQNNARTLDSLDLWQCAHHFFSSCYTSWYCNVMQCKTFKASLVLLAIVLPMNYGISYSLNTHMMRSFAGLASVKDSNL